MPPARLALALGLGLWLGALAGDPGRGCGPCAPPCLCGPAPGAACRVNCSGRGLRTLGPALRIPADATALDVSHNLLRALDVGILANLSALTELDISNNKISTLEEGTFANLFNLSEINLSGNPLECDCGLAWLPRWVEEQRVHVVQPEAATCAGPGPLAGLPLLRVPLSDGGCGEKYVACLPNNSSGATVLVAFSVAHEGPLVSEACSAFCFSTGQDFAALSEQGHCLCGTAHPPNTSSICLSFCSSSPQPPAPACGGPTVLQNVFPASPGAALVGPQGPLASGQPAAFHVTALLPVSSTHWDFGDSSPEVDIAGPASVHHYVLPGRYHVTAVLALGAGSAQLRTEVQVEAAPAALELMCPASVHSDETLELSIRNRGGSGLEATYSIMALGEEPVQVVHPLCPSDTEIFPGNGHCYRLVAEKAAWLQAQEQCRAWAGAALAMVDSPAIQHFLVSRVTRGLDVWIGFSAVEGAEAGPRSQGEAFSLESCQNWLPGEPHPATAERCVRLGPAGQCNTDLCSAPHSYVCELRPGGPVWDAENFLLGAPSGDLQGPLSPLAQQEALSAPEEPVEVMVFPGLGLSREAFLTAAEFGTQELGRPAQMRLQVYRPMGGAGVPANSSEPERRSLENRTELAPDCTPEGVWCPRSNICLPLDTPCYPQANGSTAGPGLPGASYTLWREFLFSVPAGPPAQYSVAFRGQDGPLLPGDLIGFQHDAGPGALLRCTPALSHPGPEAPYFSTNASGWLGCLPTQLEASRAGQACALQLLTATERLTPLLGLRPNPGLRRPGRYEVQASVGNSVSRWNLSCSFDVLSSVAGLRVVHPTPHDGLLYMSTNGSALVLQVDSGANATAMVRWPGGNISAPFEATCPDSVAALVPSCAHEANNTLFSVLALPRLHEGEHAVEVVVENSASRANLSLWVKVEEPICGLRAMPSPEARVLQGVLVRYSPVVEAGSDVVFRWTIDDKQSLTFHNVVFNVIYQSAAVFKLSLTATNHVSNVTVNYNVTVERMHKMRGLRVSAVPPVLPPNATLELAADVLVDSAVEVAFLWTFGDGEQVIGQFKPPYDESFQVPDPMVAQVLVEHNTTHTYTIPGEYNLTLLVSNAFENLTQLMPVSVRAILPAVAVAVGSPVLVAGRPVTFSPHPLPSPGSILYTWDFGDGSPAMAHHQPMVNHTYTSRGTYHICLEVNNTVSSTGTCTDVRVFEELRGLRVSLSSAVEQGTPVVVSAALESGDNVTWTFDMGDGTVLTGPEAAVEHVYLQARNYTVTVGVSSPAGHLAQSLPVQVFVLEVLWIDPVACIPVQPQARLTAHVTGNPAHYVFDWTFGDGSSNMTIWGDPTVTHNFTQSGTFPLVLILSSRVNKAHYFTSVCVEPEVGNVTLLPERQFVRLGDKAQLVAHAWPPFHYRYTWDFGTEDAPCVGVPEATFTYWDAGSYLVTVTVSNNISAANDSALVEVQEPVELTGIRVNGSRVLELQQPYLFSTVGHGHPVTYLWELGDGARLEGPSVTHIYTSTGHFTVRVAGWNEVSRGEAQLNVSVQRRVQGLSINASRTVVPLNGSVSFSTSLEAGSDVRYSWVLCDRCTPIPGGPTISYTFRSVGTFNIIVTAENEVGAAQDSIFVYVLQRIEGLQVAGGGGGCCFPTNSTLQLQAVVRDGTNISYGWTAQRDSGTTLVGSGKTFSLTVLEAGTYHIQLRATNMLGSASTNRTVEFVEPVGWLSVAASPNPAPVNVSVTFCAELAGGSDVIYTWSLEEGLSWETPEPSTTHTFPTPGLYLVTVTAKNQLGLANITIELAVQVPVSGLSIRASELDGSFVTTGSTVPFWGQVASGTNVSWCWAVPGGSRHGQHVTVAFPDAGTFSVQLNASNAISWLIATHSLVVEEPVVGLVLWASSKVVEPGQLVHFQILLASGSAVSFHLQVAGAGLEALPGPRFSRSFPRVGDYTVSIQAENHVSRAQAQARILVLEAVGGLQVPNCCEAGIATGTERNFTARVQRGSRVAYAWYFSLQKVQGDSLVILSGREVTYTPVAAGLLEIHVRAFNELGGVNQTLVVEVQDVIQYVALRSGRCFTNRSARFEAATSPSPRRVAYHWDFGDGAPAEDTEDPWAEHSYLQPGDYHVEVNASNLVSFFVAQATVTVHVLACREPKVDVALPPQVLMRRSQRNYLEAHIDLRGCVSYQTEYRWEVYRAASCQRPGRTARVSLPGVDVSRPQLVVPRLVLPVGHYCFVFVVSFGDTPLSQSIQANVTVAPERLVPIVEGGSYRVWSDVQDLVLDGSKSYDPNLEDGDQTPLSFHWACVASTQSETGGCVLNFGPRGNSIVTIPRERLQAGVEYTFNLTVWKAGRKEEATNQTVLIRSGRVPIVSLECVSCKAQGVYAVSRSSYVYLEGHCDNCSEGSKRGLWAARTFSNKTLVLDETTTSTGSTGMRLVVRRGVLRDGEGYTFTLTVLGRSGEEEGCASIRLSPNRPPLGGSCHLFPLDAVRALTTKVHFECTGWRDAEDAGAPLVYALLLQRCRQGHCEEFCVYKGSLSTYGAVLPPGFAPHFEVGLAVVVQDQLGAAVVALNRSLAITLPEPPGDPLGGPPELTPWLHSLTESMLPRLLRQADPQHVIEYSLALITVLNEYEQTLAMVAEPDLRWQLQAEIRKNITETLVSLRVNTVDDIQQIAAVLAQCMAASREPVCRPCLQKTLHKLEAMMRILQAETTAGTGTPTAIADSILNITGDLIHLSNSNVQDLQPSELGAEPPALRVASRAYNLSSALMCILMRSRVLNEEPLTLAGEEIVAQGKRSDPLSLLCQGNASGPGCHFSIPAAFSGALSNLSDVVQLIFLVDSNPFPFGYISNYTVSTKVASMAFQTQAGTQIPIGQLASERAITVKVPNSPDQAARVHRIPAGSAIVPPRASVSAVVTPNHSKPEAGLHLQLTYTVLNEHYLSEEPEPYLAVYLHSAPWPNEHNCSASRKISLEALVGQDHRPYTFFIAPGTRDLGGSYYLNLTSHFRWSALDVSVGLYTSLCQYFSEKEMMWRTEGLVPLEETSPSQAVCLTRHLTAFGASLFVPPSHVHFIFPEPAVDVNYVVLLTCAMCLVTYVVTAVILRKLDQLDVSRVRVIPFCGKGGRFKYEILVKTGWGRGSGTTAHVGIMLYGADSRSGHRHLDGDRAFHRNSLDIFQIATPHSLGSVWKIRVWHDNKGLSPAWFLQHVIVRDLQTARSTFFLVNDWLSVETEANGGLVEKEVLAASDAALRRFQRLLVAELQRGFFDKHIWLSIWDRPPRSRFTRVQRATCCVLLICLFLGANAVWYGVVGDTAYSSGPVSSLIPLSVDTIAVGLVSSVVVYPIYLVILFLFRMSRSKVAGAPNPTPTGQQVLDMDSYLDSSVLDSSFLTFPGPRAEAFAGQMKSDLFLDDSKSLVCWPSSEGTLSWPDLLSDPSIMGSTLQRLARGRMGHILGPEEDSLSLVSPSSPAKYFSASDEDLIRQILAEGVSSLAPTQDTQVETDLLTGLSSAPGEKTEMLMLQRRGESGLPSPGLMWEQPPSAKLARTGLVEGLRKRLLPAWCAPLAHGLSLLLVAVAVGVSGWVGANFPPGVSVMWLLSSSSSFLASFLGWEPLKVLLEALYFSLVAKRLHPDEDDTLVESPAVTPVSERVPRVRPPHGFALFLAKEEARKVKRLHKMLRSLLVYMLFLLVTLLANYGDASCHSHAYRLQSAIRQELDSQAFLAITRSDEFWPWMSHVLLPYVHGNQSSPELGPPRLRQVRLKEALCPDRPDSGAHTCSAASGGFSTSDYGIGWGSAAHNGSEMWAYSAPDALGVWYWGYCSVYDSGGYVQELGLSLEESREQLGFLQLHNWIDNRSRAVFVELTRYSPAVGLHAAVTLRLEFPVAGHAVASLSVRPFALRRLSAGLSLPLLTTVSLLLFALYFSVAETRAWRREGRVRLARPGAWARWLLVALTAAAALLRLAQLGAADRQWTRFVRRRPRRFTSFEQVAQLSAAARGLAASLLFLLLVKATQQLRFVRQWSVFGKTLCRALPELLGAALGLVTLAVAYAQLAVLLVSSCVDSLKSAAQALLVVCPRAGWPALCPESWRLSPVLCTGLWALRLWGALRLGAVLLRWRYHTLRGELYRPAWEPQDYEMVELLLRRLRLWMGFSKVKEFRHKVRFEGMEPLPSRSSRGSKSSPDVPPPTGDSDASRLSTSSSQLDGLGVGLGRPGPRVEPEPSRLQAVFEALLAQFDRLNQATEDVYQLERRLQSLHGQRTSRSPALPAPGSSTGLQSALPGRLARASRGIGLTTSPSRASLRAKNKVHPSST
ncbi:polycystin-1 isoform X4 [Myotis myotis]|uniref:Polycystin 1, transient receptor potential channel interacting n=1 Tax=Myotis myotis TaxID=51298 RepID=A0A7J7Y1Q0_MYOMY|nr:polycystin-1 isoform X4 [Myotis myotis]KAF6355734.1 polycystin 1, transient receptor potential channel interacting [Myotis myotis]